MFHHSVIVLSGPDTPSGGKGKGLSLKQMDTPIVNHPGTNLIGYKDIRKRNVYWGIKNICFPWSSLSLLLVAQSQEWPWDISSMNAFWERGQAVLCQPQQARNQASKQTQGMSLIQSKSF